MCTSDQLKEPIYKVVRQNLRDVKWVNNAVGGPQWAEDEANRGIQNPGYALTRGAEAAASGYAAATGLGGLLGGAGSAGAAGADAAVAGSATTAQELAAQQAAQQALEQAAQQTAAQAPQGFANTMEAALTDTGYTPSSLLNAFNNPSATTISAMNRGLGTGISQTGLLSSGSSTGKGGLLAGQMGMQLLNAGQQRPQMPMSPPPRGGNMEPLNTPYSQNAFGPGGNSLGGQYLTEEQKRRLRMQQGLL